MPILAFQKGEPGHCKMALERLDIENCEDRLQAFLHRQRYDFVLSRLGRRDDVLEIGTGIGAFTRELVSRCDNYVGVEFDSLACEEARRRTEGKASILQADARHLPFADETFSFIVCLEVLEHLGNWKKGVHEIHRCLKKEGTGIISVPYRRRGGRNDFNEYHLYEPGKGELIMLLNRLFERIETRYQTFGESFFMTLARRLHIRRFVGLADQYANLSRGEPSALNRLSFGHSSKGLKIGLVVVASGKK